MSALTTPAQIDHFRLAVIRSAIKLYLNTGMRVNRHYTVSVMARCAEEYTGSTYKATKKGLRQAFIDLGGNQSELQVAP